MGNTLTFSNTVPFIFIIIIIIYIVFLIIIILAMSYRFGMDSSLTFNTAAPQVT